MKCSFDYLRSAPAPATEILAGCGVTQQIKKLREFVSVRSQELVTRRWVLLNPSQCYIITRRRTATRNILDQMAASVLVIEYDLYFCMI